MTLPVLFPGHFLRRACSPSCCPGEIFRCRSTRPAPTPRLPEYLYAKMVAGYTPGVPVLGTVSTLGAIVVLLGGYGLIAVVRRARMRPARRAADIIP